MAELLSAIIAGIALMGTIIGVWLNLNIKIKGIEMKIAEMEHKFADVKENNEAIIKTIEKNNDRIWSKLDQIIDKLDDKFNQFNILQDQHNNMWKKCQNKDDK